MDATVIVVSYNKLPYTQLCLEGMLQCNPRPRQIIVVDNGSTDGSREYLGRSFLSQCRNSGVDLTLVNNEANLGACTARNQALELASGRYLAFADNDLAVRSRGWLRVLGECLESSPQAGIAGPKLVYPFPPYDIECAGVAISATGRVQYRGRGEPRGGVAATSPAMPQPPTGPDGEVLSPRPAWEVSSPVQCLISACWLMKRAVYEEVGGFDEVFNPAQYEDFDLCYRAREAGWEVWYTPAAEMYHYENTTTAGSVDLNFRYVTIRNGLEFKRRWQHRFSVEGGPPDEACRWRELPTRPIEQTGVPPMVD